MIYRRADWASFLPHLWVLCSRQDPPLPTVTLPDYV
jgi:hypothetical protein